MIFMTLNSFIGGWHYIKDDCSWLL
jgi:hypothetical protein